MKILLGMSGGLDSTYAGHLMREAGHEVEGAVLVMHGYTDISAAEKSAAELGIPLRVIDCRADFDREVALPFAEEYRRGRTPNPCILCNERVKFAALYRAMREGGFDRMATGHYAQIARIGTRLAIRRGEDGRKDQSYVLWRLPQEILAALMLPLSDCDKTRVRAHARALGFSAAESTESMEICFLPNGNHADYVEARLGPIPRGEFVDTDGRVLGTHGGIHRYTVGQRKGLGIALGERMFISHIDASTNRITLATGGERGVQSLSVRDLVFSGLAPQSEGEGEFEAVLRYQARPLPARVRFFEGRARVSLLTPATAVTPGQSAVFYRDGAVAFGGFIE